MNSSRKKLEELLWLTGLHSTARSLYSATFGRNSALARNKMKDFYRSILQPQMLVFDIGANVGVLSSTFASLGARVIAVEPNADCVRHIQIAYQDQEIQVIQAAVGERDGLAVLNIADERDVTSSISDDWMNTMAGRDDSYRGVWSRRSVVPMLTLDHLVEHFGKPDYIKIDVEGFEEKVLGGLSIQPPLLSFEFTTALLAQGMRCVDSPVFKEGSRFNFVFNADWGYPSKFEKETWMTKEELKRTINGLEGQGDIFVRSPE